MEYTTNDYTTNGSKRIFASAQPGRMYIWATRLKKETLQCLLIFMSFQWQTAISATDSETKSHGLICFSGRFPTTAALQSWRGFVSSLITLKIFALLKRILKCSGKKASTKTFFPIFPPLSSAATFGQYRKAPLFFRANPL